MYICRKTGSLVYKVHLLLRVLLYFPAEITWLDSEKLAWESINYTCLCLLRPLPPVIKMWHTVLLVRNWTWLPDISHLTWVRATKVNTPPTWQGSEATDSCGYYYSPLGAFILVFSLWVSTVEKAGLLWKSSPVVGLLTLPASYCKVTFWQAAMRHGQQKWLLLSLAVSEIIRKKLMLANK